MIISGLLKLTLLDYPGKTAATVFIGGCNLRCVFCHNTGIVCDPASTRIPEEELFAYLKKRQGILDGVCITGGEPLMSPDTPSLIARIKELGYSVKLDTNGTYHEKLKALVSSGLVDYVAMDVKNSPEKYAATCGINGEWDGIDAVMRSVELLKLSGLPHEFRTTLVTELHTVEDVEKMAQWIGDGESYFLQRFVDSGAVMTSGLTTPSDELMQMYLKAARKYVTNAQLRGM